MDLLGWYLFGAPVMNDIEYTIAITPIVYKSQRFPEYSFSTQLYDYYDEYDEYRSSPTLIAMVK